MHRTQVYRWGAALALLAAVLGLAEAQFHLLRRVLGRGALTQRELAMEYLGGYLAKQYPGRKAVVLSNPFSTQPGQPRAVYQYEKAGLRGLRRGLGKAVRIEAVAFPELKPAFLKDRRSVFVDPRTTTPLSYIVTEDALDRIARAHPEAEILVSLIGLPVNVRQTETWKSDNPKKFALLLPDLRMVGDDRAVRDAIYSGKIVAIVLNKPGAPSEDQSMGRDSKMEFERRYLLVNRETIDRLLQVYPRLFP